MAFTIEYAIPMSRERVIAALRHRAVHWRESKTPESLQALGVFRIEVRISGSTFALFCRTTHFRSPVCWYELRGSIQSLTARTTIVEVRAGLIRRYGVHVMMVGLALMLIANGAFRESLVPLGFLVYFVGFNEVVDRCLRPGKEPVINHLVDRLQDAMAELGGVIVDRAPTIGTLHASPERCVDQRFAQSGNDPRCAESSSVPNPGIVEYPRSGPP